MPAEILQPLVTPTTQGCSPGGELPGGGNGSTVHGQAQACIADLRVKGKSLA